MADEAAPFEVIVKIPLTDAPKWLSHIEISRDGDHVLFEVVRTNGYHYGSARMDAVQFNEVADLATTVRG